MAESGVALSQGPNPGLTRKLASTDKKTRDKAVALLALWIACQQDVEEDNLKKVWKGLFYCVWHSDKAPVQAELIENLASLLEKADVDVSITFFKVFLSTMRREWGGIDRLRLDKFYLLLRRFLAHMFKVMESRGWDQAVIVKFMAALEERAFFAKDRFPALGVNLHFTDVYLDEFRKFLPVPRGVLEPLLEPFFSILSRSTEKPMLKRVRDSIFNPLVEDGQNLTQDVNEKRGVEKKAQSLGFLLPSTPVASRLFDLASSASTPQANRKVLYELHDEFSKVAKLLETVDGSIYDSWFQSKQGNTLGKYAGQAVSSIPEELLEEGGGGTRSRLRRKQARAQALGVKDTISFKSKKGSKSKLLQSKKKHDDDSHAVIVENGDGEIHMPEPTGEEEDVLQEGSTRKKRNPNNTVITVGTNLPLLQKRLSKKKDKKKKKELAALAGFGGTEGKEITLDTPAVQTTATPVSVIENGHQSINDVTMNLEKQFDFVAAEDQNGTPNRSSPAAPSSDASCETRSKRKRKKDKSTGHTTPNSEVTPNDLQNAVALAPTPVKSDAAPTDGNEESVKKSKKVRFALRNNIVWKPQGPLPPLSVRTPPSATPRGSALKAGVSPGPIRTRPIRARTGTSLKSRKRASKQYISASAQKPTRTSTRKVRRTSL